jgi:hypothetical protein
MSFPTTMSWPEDWGIDPDAFKSLSELTAELTEKFAEFHRQFSQVIVEHQRDLPHLLSVMVAQSWYPDFSLPIADLRAIEARAIAGDLATIDSYLSEFFRRNAADVENRISEEYPDRKPVIAEAFSAYRTGNFVLAIPVFLAQADGISEALLSEHFFRSGKSIPEAQKLLRDGRHNDYIRLLLFPLVQSGTIRDHTSTLHGKTDYLNRHAIMHGMDLSYGTEINALKCISLLAYLLSATQFTS